MSTTIDKSAESPAPSEKKSAMRKWLGRLLYVAFLLIVVEVSLQGFYYAMVGQSLLTRVAAPNYQRNEHSVYRNKPNLATDQNTNEFRTKVYTNADGFRVPKPGIEYAKGRDTSKFRVLLMGPSFAFGSAVNYEDTFGAQLQSLLQKQGYAGGKTIELINAGVPSLVPARQLNWYKNAGKDYAPDLVIQFIYDTANVNPDPDLNSDEVTEDGYRIIKNATTKDRIRGAVKKSAIVFYTWMLSAKLQSAMAANEPAEGGKVLGTGQDSRIYTTFKPDSPEVVASLRYYDDLRQSAEANGARSLCVFFPLSYCIHREDVARWKHLGVRNVDEQMGYNAAFCDYLQERGIPCHDITPELVEAAKKDRLYFWLDIHWTVKGNLEAARAVANRLLAEEAKSEAAGTTGSTNETEGQELVTDAQ